MILNFQERYQRSLSKRFSYTTVGVVVLVLVAFSITAIIYSIVNTENEKNDLRQNISVIGSAYLDSTLWNLDKDSVRNIANALFIQKRIVYVQISDETGVLHEIKAPPYKDLNFSFFSSSSRFITESSDIYYKGKKVGSFRFAFSTESYRRELRINILSIFVLTVVIIIAISLTSITITKRHIFQPLKKLEESAACIAAGNLDSEIDTTGKDELGNLARAFDLSRQSIKALIEQLDASNKTLKARTFELEKRTADLTASQEQLRKAKKVAEKANKAKGRLLSNVSHDIRTPLNAILGFTRILFEETDDPKLKERLSTIRASGDDLLKLVNGILNIEKIDAGKLVLNYEAIDLYETLDHIKALFLPRITAKGLAFNISIDKSSTPSYILFDDLRLKEILSNLVDNAVRYTDEGFINIQCRRKKNRKKGMINLFITVQDSGTGIPKDKLKSIFNNYEQLEDTDNSICNGTGLGLTIVKSLTKHMKGKVSVESDTGKGCRFDLEFKNVKIAQASDVTKKADTSTTGSIIFSDTVILIADDVESNRTLIRDYLSHPSFKILEAVNGPEAVKFSKQYKPDIIIMDIKMPEMDGFEATRLIKSDPDLKAIPVIALTASVTKEQEDKAKVSGCDAFLKKPIDKNELMYKLMDFISYQQIKNNEQEGTDGDPDEHYLEHFADEPLSDEILAKLPALLQVLEAEISEKYQLILDAGTSDDIVAFSQTIKGLGVKYQINSLAGWSNKLHEYVEIFDYEKIKITLHQFPKIVTALKEKIKRRISCDDG